MSEKTVIIVSSIAIINLLITTSICWFKSRKVRFYFWLGCLIFAATFAMINNLHIFMGYGNIWVYHVSLLLNVSYGGFLILFVHYHRQQKAILKFNPIWLFTPSILYVPFIIICIINPEWADRTILFSETGKMTIFGTIYNLIIVFYSIGSNILLLLSEIRITKLNQLKIIENPRAEMLAVMLGLQLCAFVPFILAFDIRYVMLYMPVFGQLFYMYLFFKLRNLEYNGMTMNARSLNLNIKTPLKYANIKLSEEKIKEIKKQVLILFEAEQLFLMPDFSLNDLAKRVNISANLLSMVINSQLNLSFSDFINKYRIEHAKELLNDIKSNRYTIESVAYDCGFSNRTSFYNAFRKFANQSPTDYLKEIKKGNLSLG